MKALTATNYHQSPCGCWLVGLVSASFAKPNWSHCDTDYSLELSQAEIVGMFFKQNNWFSRYSDNHLK